MYTYFKIMNLNKQQMHTYLYNIHVSFLQEFLKDLDSLVIAFEKETTASGQRNVLSKIQHGLIAAQDIGDDKLITVQAMSDLIENKSRQLEHDSKILDFGKDDDDDTVMQTKNNQTTSGMYVII